MNNNWHIPLWAKFETNWVTLIHFLRPKDSRTELLTSCSILCENRSSQFDKIQ